ncbi:hypothetical protein TNCV_4721151 [Trichonephila clavipes]|uniref:Uncharacterized protein n=1 Tax=Trichonephila clavipes TaxID=2585209 RepID=A0A8X6W629_TRICX|nr:hypothetical protein TNCV_4721151 [Trichonephila clavipes]
MLSSSECEELDIDSSSSQKSLVPIIWACLTKLFLPGNRENIANNYSCFVFSPKTQIIMKLLLIVCNKFENTALESLLHFAASPPVASEFPSRLRERGGQRVSQISVKERNRTSFLLQKIPRSGTFQLFRTMKKHMGNNSRKTDSTVPELSSGKAGKKNPEGPEVTNIVAKVIPNSVIKNNANLDLLPRFHQVIESPL